MASYATLASSIPAEGLFNNTSRLQQELGVFSTQNIQRRLTTSLFLAKVPYVLKRRSGEYSVKRTRVVSVHASVATAGQTELITGQTELDAVSAFSEIVPDTVIADDFQRFPPTAATVSFSFLLGITSLPEAKYDSAIESALAYGKCMLEEAGGSRMSCFVDKALVNVGAELSREVPGRVSTEIDARLANDSEAIIRKVRSLLHLYNEVDVAPQRLLFKIPATWQGIEAARQLEADGIQTHLTGIHSFAQAAACSQAAVSVIQISLARIREWARAHTGDADVDAAVREGKDPGVDLVIRASDHIFRNGHKSMIMVSNIRNKEDVFNLLGVDYLVVPVKVLKSLQDSHAMNQSKYQRQIKATTSGAATSSKVEVWDEKKFASQVGVCAKQLLAAEIDSAVAQTLRLEEHFTKIWPPPNV